jgi:hypothetical protein
LSFKYTFIVDPFHVKATLSLKLAENYKQYKLIPGMSLHSKHFYRVKVVKIIMPLVKFLQKI